MAMDNTTIFLQSTWSQFSNWSTPFDVGFAGETTHLANDVPGSTALKLSFGNMQVQDFFADTWHNTCGYVSLASAHASRYTTDAPACNNVRVWTP